MTASLGTGAEIEYSYPVPEPLRACRPPPQPVLIFDGDCRFCCFWIERWRRVTGEQIRYLPFQEPAVFTWFPEGSRDRLERAVHLIEPSGAIYSGAEAVFRSLASNSRWKWLLAVYRHVPGAARLSEWVYRLVASHRSAFSTLTHLLLGRKP